MSNKNGYTASSLGFLVKNEDCVIQESYEADIQGQHPKSKKSIHRRARNLLRFFIQGTPVLRNQNYKQGLDLVEKALTADDSPDTADILDALRLELIEVFKTAFDNLEKQDKTKASFADDEKLFEILLSNLISLYSFCDPVRIDNEGNILPLEKLSIPQKIAGTWKLVEYQPERLDISPKKGPLSLHNRKDKIYAYGFRTDIKEAHSWIAFRGTPPPSLPGSKFADLYNFKPFSSIGEGHNFESVDAFIAAAKSSNTKVDVTGHSQGATIALITGMRHPGVVGTVHALNPAGLSAATLAKFKKKWKSYLKDNTHNKTNLTVYAQKKDFAVLLGRGFPKGTNYYLLDPTTALCSDYKKRLPKFIQKRAEAHIRFFAGQDSVKVNSLELSTINSSFWREWLSDLTTVLNFVVFPMKYLALAQSFLVERIKNFYEKHKKAFMLALGIALIAIAISCGLAAHVSVPVFAAIIAIALSGALISPELIRLIYKLLELASKVIEPVFMCAFTITVMPVVAFISAVNILAKNLISRLFEILDEFFARSKNAKTIVANENEAEDFEEYNYARFFVPRMEPEPEVRNELDEDLVYV